MDIKNLLHSGHTFTPAEYELETKYVATNILLFFMTPVYFGVSFFYVMGDELLQASPYVLAFIINIFSLVTVRMIDKNNYQLIVYISMAFYTIAIFLAYYIEPEFTPMAAWVIILIIASFLVTSIYVGMLITIVYFFFLIYMDFYVLGFDSYEYLVLKITPVVIGLFAVYMFERKFVSTILLLEKSNIELENKVTERTAQLKEEKESLDYQAHYDDLTALPNRHKFHKELRTWIHNADKDAKHFFLLFIDLDRFKRVNDSLGHATGDTVLKIVSKRIQNHMDTHAFLSRLSGDEFTLLLNDEYQLFDVENIVQSLITTIEEPMTVEDNVLYISASIGISQYPEDAVGYADLIKFADTSMFEAKKVGRGTYQFYNKEMTRKVKEIVLMETELHAAMKKHEFRLYYQPQIDSRDESLSGVEILIRWEHPNLGLLCPDKFIPLAEDTGIIIALDYYILKCGMQQVSQWKKEGYTLPRVSFNFSTKYLLQENFISDIKQLLWETGCKGEWIELEITESHIMANIDASIIVLDALHDLGIKIAIDDFGTGYSSLTYLKRLPADKLKIDKSFIEKISANMVDMTITKAIIEIGNSMGLTVLAEGVETQEQLDYLAKHECYQIQGYIYHEALSKTEIEKTVFKHI